jgi:microcystin-dependent protein
MKPRSHRITRCLTLAASLAAAAGWNSTAYACSSEPYLSAVCIMAWNSNDFRDFMPAAGQLLNVSQNAALFALLGTTYGGNGQTNFALPDLRGRVVVGAGTGTDGITYNVGQSGGVANPTLTSAQMPGHVHTAGAVSLNGVVVALDLSKVTGATAALGSATFTANTSALTLKAVNANGTVAAPTGASLAIAAAPAGRIYASAAPNVDMAAGTFGGSIAVSSTSTVPVTLPASASATLSGSAPGSGNTGPAGGSTPFSNMQPYLAMNYFIAVQGFFPSRN